MSEAPSLGVLERWMQHVLVHPVSAAEGVRSAPAASLIAPERLDSVVVAEGVLTPAERLGIYQEMYLLRMSEALESDFPALARHLGPHRFWHFVSDYVEVHPSRSYTLNRLGDEVAAFASGWGPKRERGRLCGLARLEGALNRVFDAEEEAPVGIDVLAGIEEDELANLRLRPVPAFALVKVRASAASLYDSLQRETESDLPGGNRVLFVMFFRKDFRVHRKTLSRTAGTLLDRLTSGVPLGQALSSLPRTGKGNSCEQVTQWCRDWVTDGIFAEAFLEGDSGLR